MTVQTARKSIFGIAAIGAAFILVMVYYFKG